MPFLLLGTVSSLGYDPDIAKNRAEACKIIEKLGYGPEKRLSLTLSSRTIPGYRQPAVGRGGRGPIIFYSRGGACTQPYVKRLVTMVNSIDSGYRMQVVWLDK